MKIALAVLVLSPVLLAGGCKEKAPTPPPLPPDPVIGEWACTIDTETAKARIDAAFAGDGTITAKIAITSSPAGRRAIANLDASGKWSRTGSSFTQSLALTVTASTINGQQAPEAAAKALARSLSLSGRGVVVRKLDAAEFVYETRSGLVNCMRQAELPAP